MLRHTGTNRIETPRLILRKFKLDDGEIMFKNWANDERVTKYLSWEPHQSLKLTNELLETWCAHYDKNTYNYAIVLKEIGEIIGSVSAVKIDEEANAFTFGYCIGHDYWGREIVPEAMSAVFSVWFNEVGAERIIGSHVVENLPSGRVMQKLGMRKIGVEKGTIGLDSHEVDCTVYEITKEEYDGVKIRKAMRFETDCIDEIYIKLTDYLAVHKNYCGWKSGVYPIKAVAERAMEKGELFVAIKSGRIVGSVVLNTNQAPQYSQGEWEYNGESLVIHTLAIDPNCTRQGIGDKIMEFAEEYACAEGLGAIHLDTAEANLPAQRLYEKHGYKKVGEVNLEIDRIDIDNWFLYEKVL